MEPLLLQMLTIRAFDDDSRPNGVLHEGIRQSSQVLVDPSDAHSLVAFWQPNFEASSLLSVTGLMRHLARLNESGKLPYTSDRVRKPSP